MPVEKLDYQMTEDSLEIFDELNKKIFGTDIILFLLSIGKIKGKIVFQKQVFLTWKELFFEKAVDLGYVPYRYGAYSKIIDDAAKYLEHEGLIKIIKRKGDGTIFLITDYGLKEVKDRIKNLNITLSGLTNRKQDWDEWDKEGIMRYTYRKYPEYTTEAILSRFKWASQ